MNNYMAVPTAGLSSALACGMWCVGVEPIGPKEVTAGLTLRSAGRNQTWCFAGPRGRGRLECDKERCQAARPFQNVE